VLFLECRHIRKSNHKINYYLVGECKDTSWQHTVLCGQSFSVLCNKTGKRSTKDAQK
jgi:hypothetical protein